MTRSLLEDIPGVGQKSIEKLFIRFKSVEGVKAATLEDLTEELGFSRAKKVKQHLERGEK